jgi:GNAT superfamily N-acetyltransferase
MTVRRLDAADAAAWRGIRLEMLARAPRAYAEMHVEWADRPLNDFAAWLERIRLFGAFEPELAGTLGWMRHRGAAHEHRATVVAAYVRPSHRGHGVLGRLMQALVADASREILQLELGVAADNPRARAAYARLGFVELGIEPRALRHGDVFTDEIRMWRRLDA